MFGSAEQFGKNYIVDGEGKTIMEQANKHIQITKRVSYVTLQCFFDG